MRSFVSLAIVAFAFIFSPIAFAGGPFDPAMWSDVADKIPEGGMILAILGGVLDLFLRWKKTEKPKSIIRGVAVALHGLARVADKLAALCDKVLGQNAADKAAEAVPPMGSQQ